jgi:hypothetical protein
VIVGRWRVRPRWHRRKYSAFWANRTCFPEGTVYRAAVGPIQVTVMVDAMTPQKRRERKAQTNALIGLFNR